MGTRRGRTELGKRYDQQAATPMVSLYFLLQRSALCIRPLRVTPAMEARLTDRVWAVEEIIALFHFRTNT